MIYHNEIDPACCKILARHFPGSMIDSRSIEDVQAQDLKSYPQCHFFAGIGGFSLAFQRTGIPDSANVWTGGFPCQDLSVAGKREGLAGKRSGLYFAFQRLIADARPRWVVVENVPGLLSSNKGRDFALVLGGLTGVIPEVPKGGWGSAGFFRGIYCVAYRVLDAQFFGVPQRRRRVFLVASLGSGRCAEVLFEREGVPGDPAPSRKKGQGIARSPEISPALSCEGHDSSEDGTGRHALIISTAGDQPYAVGNPLTARMYKGINTTLDEGQTPVLSAPLGSHHCPRYDLDNETYVIQDGREIENKRQNGKGWSEEGVAYTLDGLNTQAVAFNTNEQGSAGNRIQMDAEVSVTLQGLGGGMAAKTGMYLLPMEEGCQTPWDHESKRIHGSEGVMATIAGSDGGGGQRMPYVHFWGVRRLTPLECERLQDFPDGWTDGQSDSTRYKQCGNAVAICVPEWIARRLKPYL